MTYGGPRVPPGGWHMARAPRWASGALASGPLTHHGRDKSQLPWLSGVPHLRPWGHRCGRRHSGGPTDEIFAKGATPCPRPHPPWRPAHPRRESLPDAGTHYTTSPFGRGAVGRRRVTCTSAAGPRPRNTSGRLRRHLPGHRGPRPRNTSERPRESRLIAGFYVFSFTAGLLAPEAPRHPLFSVSKKDLWTQWRL